MEKRTGPQTRLQTLRCPPPPSLDATTQRLALDSSAARLAAPRTGRRRSAAAPHGAVLRGLEEAAERKKQAQAAQEAYLEQVCAASLAEFGWYMRAH